MNMKKHFSCAILLFVLMGLSATGQVPANGLVGYWPFNGNAYDESGNGLNGTVTGAALTTDRFGNANSAYYFDGTGKYIQVPDNALLRPGTITISLWVNSSNVVPHNQNILSKQNLANATGEQYAINLQANSNHNYPLFSIKKNSNGCQAGVGWQTCYYATVSSINTWHHIVGTYSGDTMKVYHDNVVSVFCLVSGPIDNCLGGNLNIGRSAAQFTDYFMGSIDDVRIYNRALSAAEVAQLYNESTCSPAPTGRPWLSPQWGCLPCVEQTVPYNEVLTFENFDSIPGFSIQSTKIDSITHLPAGLSYAISPSSATFPRSGIGCINISGTTSDTAGTYKLGVWITITLSGLGSFNGEIDQIIDNFILLGIIDTSVIPRPDLSYYVRVIQQGGNCVMTGGPTSSFAFSAANYTVSFTDQSTATPTSWLWTFGDGDSSASQNPIHDYTAAGNYNVCLTATSNCGSGTSCQTVSVTCTAPAVSFGYQVSGLSVSFSDSSANTPTGWNWTFGDGGSSNQKNPSHNYSATGTYNVCLSATNACGANSACQNITLTCNVSAFITANATNICTGDTATLSASTGTGYAYQWYRNGSVIQDADSAVYQATQAGAYSVNISAGGCSATAAAVTVTVHPAPQVSITASGLTTFCSGGSVTLQATAGFASYLWSSGSTASSTLATMSGAYTVTATDSNGCIATDTFYLNASTLSPPDICIVGLDSATNKNIIVWEKPVSAAIDSYIVYKETNQANVYVRIGAQPYSAFSAFIDTSSIPQQQAYRYELGIVDSCGSHTLPGSYQKTIHLTINQGVGNTWNLIWSHYEGFTFPSYNIYRGTSQSALTQIATIASNLNSYTDLNPPSGPFLVYYQIEVVNPNSCNPTAKMGNYSVSRSNIVNTGAVGMMDNTANFKLKLYPNPFSNTITIEIPEGVNGKCELRLTDLTGSVIRSIYPITGKTIILKRENLPRGVYFVELQGEKRYFGKIMVQ